MLLLLAAPPTPNADALLLLVSSFAGITRKCFPSTVNGSPTIASPLVSMLQGEKEVTLISRNTTAASEINDSQSGPVKNNGYLICLDTAMSEALTALNTCNDDSLRNWNFFLRQFLKIASSGKSI